MLRFARQTKGATPPVQIPILLFVYTLVFLILVEFVMLFWLVSSLNGAARQVALKAATTAGDNGQAFNAEDAAQRCTYAVNNVGQLFPGYSSRIRADYVDAVVNGNAAFDDFDEINQSGTLRTKLGELGAQKPSALWGNGGTNAQHGGCYALRNQETKQITYHTIIHCSDCWPVFLKGLGLTMWLEGRSSYPVTASGIPTAGVSQATQELNRSLQGTGVRPFLFCSQDDCDVDSGGDQSSIAPSNGQVCANLPDGYSTASRPAPNVIISGTSDSRYAIDQAPVGRGKKCTRCISCSEGSDASTRTSNENVICGHDPTPSGISSLSDCGDISPLIILGMQYACMAKDGFEKVLKAGNSVSASNRLSGDFIGRCDHYGMLKPSCRDTPADMSAHFGQVTNMDGNGGPCIIRRENGPSDTTFACRNDHIPVRAWYGPYPQAPVEIDVANYGDLDAGGNNPITWFQEAALENNLATVTPSSSSSEAVAPNDKYDGPLDMLMPYHAVCDICNPGSPMCGYYGTCRNESNIWMDSKVVHHIQMYNNSSFISVNPINLQLECKYQRDCMERHCCKDADPATLLNYCSNRGISGAFQENIAGVNEYVLYGQKCTDPGGNEVANQWTYTGVPNEVGENWTSRTLPRLGGFPQCSTGAVRMLQNRAGECCTAAVKSYNLVCDTSGNYSTSGPYELAPKVDLAAPDLECARCKRLFGDDCSDKENHRFCPSIEKPNMTGNCLDEDQNFPIGGECIVGSQGTFLNGVPEGRSPTATQCGVPTLPSGCTKDNPSSCVVENCTGNVIKSAVNGSNKLITTCKTCVHCAPTPIVIVFSQSKPKLSEQTTCFKLEQTKPFLAYKSLKGNSNQGFLAFDMNGDGVINDASELFGSYTADKHMPDGYTALTLLFDKNKDGVIKGNELNKLLIWQDLNEDGNSQPEEVKSVASFGITEIDSGQNVEKITPRNKNYYLDKSKSVFSTLASKKGIKFKDKNGVEKIGYSWDVSFQGEINKACSQFNKDKTTTNSSTPLNQFLEFFNSIKNSTSITQNLNKGG